MDHLVGRSTSCGEKGWLPWAPCKSLDGCAVGSLDELGGVERSGVPDGDEVVVTTSGKLGSVRTPFKTTDLTNVGDELGDFVLGDADIVVVDKSAASTSGEGVLVPAHDTDAGFVSEHAAKLGTFLDIPDLDLTRAKSDTDVSTISAPLDTADVGIGAAFEERVDSSRLCRPDINVAFKADGDLIARAPVEKVEVVVIDEAGSIQDSLRCGCDSPAELRRCGVGRLQRSVILRTEVDRPGGLWGGRLESEDAGVEADSARRRQGRLIGCSTLSGLGSCQWLIIIKVKVIECGHGFVNGCTSANVESAGSIGENCRALSPRVLVLLVLVEPDGASRDDGLASGAAGDEAVYSIV